MLRPCRGVLWYKFVFFFDACYSGSHKFVLCMCVCVYVCTCACVCVRQMAGFQGMRICVRCLLLSFDDSHATMAFRAVAVSCVWKLCQLWVQVAWQRSGQQMET